MKKLENGRYECTTPNCKCHDEDYCLAQEREQNRQRINNKKDLNGRRENL